MHSKRKRGSSNVLTACAITACLWSLSCFAQFGNPRFSPDEQYLAFDYCQDRCNFVVYSFKSNSATRFDAPKGETWINPSFSPSSDRLSFVIVRSAPDTQLATVNLNGSDFRKLTSSEVIKRSPSFSPDGKLIIFVGGSKTVTERGSFSSVDLYITDMSSRDERRVTDLNVRDISAPFFLADGKTFTFSTVGSAIPRSGSPKPIVPLDKLFPNRTVFLLQLNGSQDLRPVLQAPLIASNPSPIASGDIALLVRVNDIDHVKGNFVYDIFLASHGRAIRHTKFQSYVWSYGISRSGELASYVADGGDPKGKSKKLMLWRKSSGNAIELSIPHAKIIPLRNP